MIYGCDECGCIRRDIKKEYCNCECHKDYQNKNSGQKKDLGAISDWDDDNEN